MSTTMFMDWKAAFVASFIPAGLIIFYGMITVIRSLVTKTTEYQSNTSKIATNKVLDSLATRSWWLGKTSFVDGREVPEYAIGFWFFAYTSKSIVERKEVLAVSVMMPKWRKPLVSTEVAARDDDNDDGCLIVLEPARESKYYRYFTPERAKLLTRKMDDTISRLSEITVAMMMDALNENTNVFVMSGSPGTGKSFSARFLTFKLKKAALLTWFDPREKDDMCLNHIYNTSSLKRDERIVIVLDECDVVFLTMDKDARNAFLDMINNNPSKFILVMTTNAPLETMWEKDDSLLRDGRVFKMEITDCMSVTHVSDEMLKERVKRMIALAAPQRRNLIQKILGLFGR
jgi:hypothetical protein